MTKLSATILVVFMTLCCGEKDSTNQSPESSSRNTVVFELIEVKVVTVSEVDTNTVDIGSYKFRILEPAIWRDKNITRIESPPSSNVVEGQKFEIEISEQCLKELSNVTWRNISDCSKSRMPL